MCASTAQSMRGVEAAAGSDFDARLAEIARVPILLVASDYDGTMAPIVSDPHDARPHREAIVALNMLAALPQTHVAVISGRALRDLAELMGPPEDVHLVGSHGSEFDLDFATSLSIEAAALRDRITDDLSEIASRHEGFSIEEKPASIAFHYRNAPEEQAEHALRDVLDGPGAIEGVMTREGKKVVELGVVSTNKGNALETMRHRLGASAVIFFGDDLTDEDAFATLTGPDIAVKVGTGESRAAFRIAGPEEVARSLARLSELRAAWLEGARAVPIEQHSMLSDQRTVALLTPDARLVWMCAPRIDSSALFSELVGGPAAGHFTISAANETQATGQHYLDGTFVLKTEWPDFAVTDFLDCSGGRPAIRAGRTDLVRRIEGNGKIIVDFAPRLDFGRIPTTLTVRDGGIAVGDTHDPIVLRASVIQNADSHVAWQIVDEGPHQTARAEIDLASAGPIVLELCYGTGSLQNRSGAVDDRQRASEQFWKSWLDRLTIPAVEPELVKRSALILKGLVYGPTGAISAAATTSLPEHIGGVRNWDYRFCWLRDAAMSAAALVKLGSLAEAMQFLDWVFHVLERECDSPESLHPLYSVNGSMLGPEAEIGELAGYCGSRPVRIGNRAARQVQLDVFGPIVDLVALLMELDAPVNSNHWRLVEQLVHAVERRWREPDHGIWEIRRPPRHHVHSKVMCWHTVNRALIVSQRFLDRDRADWRALRDEIATDVLHHGFKQSVNAFTAAYDDDDLDAAALMIGLTGLLPPEDERFAGTLAAIEGSLLSGPTVYRYRSDDGLPGFEGGFHICASWLIDAYLRLGRNDDAWNLFRQMVALAGPTGSLSEQYGSRTCRALGNVPQAYSHLGIIENALQLAKLK